MVKDAEKIVSQLGIQARIECVREEKTIMQYGVFVLPALVIDGKAVTAGYKGPRQLTRVLAAL